MCSVPGDREPAILSAASDRSLPLPPPPVAACEIRSESGFGAELGCREQLAVPVAVAPQMLGLSREAFANLPFQSGSSVKVLIPGVQQAAKSHHLIEGFQMKKKKTKASSSD